MRAKLSVVAGPDGCALVALQLKLRQPREPNELELFLKTRHAELDAQDSGKEAAAQSSAEAEEAALARHRKLMAEWKALGRKAARQADNAAKGLLSKRCRGHHVRASLDVNSLGGVRLRMFISAVSTISAAGSSSSSGQGAAQGFAQPSGHGRSKGRAGAEAAEAGGTKASTKASQMGGGREVGKPRKIWPADKPAMAISLFLVERKEQLAALAPPPDASTFSQEVQNRRKRLHAQVGDAPTVALPSADHTHCCRVHATRLTACSLQASAEWLNPPSAELAARKAQLISQQALTLTLALSGWNQPSPSPSPSPSPLAPS